MSQCSKLKRLVVSLHSRLHKMVKKRSVVTRHKLPAASDSDEGDGDDSAVPPTEPHRHVAYSFDEEKRTRRTTYLPLPVSPQKRPRVSTYDSDGLPIPLHLDAHERQEDHDMEYLYHRIETLETDPSRRKRTEGVCSPRK